MAKVPNVLEILSENLKRLSSRSLRSTLEEVCTVSVLLAVSCSAWQKLITNWTCFSEDMSCHQAMLWSSCDLDSVYKLLFLRIPASLNFFIGFPPLLRLFLSDFTEMKSKYRSSCTADVGPMFEMVLCVDHVSIEWLRQDSNPSHWAVMNRR